MTMNITDLPSPCFIVDVDKIRNNAQRMLKICEQFNVQLRAHTKTHKTIEGAEIQTNGSKRCLAVSTLAEAELYAQNGFDDILLAYPITKEKVKRCIALVEKLEQFHVFVSGKSGLQCLKDSVQDLPDGKVWSVVLEIDTGYGRTGFLCDSDDIVEVARDIEKCGKMALKLIYCHDGKSYNMKSQTERRCHQLESVNKLLSVQKRIQDNGIVCLAGLGSTGTCSLPIDELKKVSEFFPGNYIFYDYEQYLLNSCNASSIACRVMTRVIHHNPEGSAIYVDCGFTALSKDGMMRRPTDFCIIEGESNLRLVSMSQEIGTITAKEGDLDCRNYPIGTVLFIIPFHSCATAASHEKYYACSEGKVVATWKPVKGW